MTIDTIVSFTPAVVFALGFESIGLLGTTA